MDEQSDRNKAVVSKLVDEVINRGHLKELTDIYDPGKVDSARNWIAAFRSSFPDVHMTTLELVAEGDTVVGRFTCTGTHRGTWRGQPPTGRRFTDIDEINIYRLHDGRITDTWTLEDNLARLTQLGIPTQAR